MKDIQNEIDLRGITINEVGITDLKVPLFYKIGKESRYIVADVTMGAKLDKKQKGTHMSRFAEISRSLVKSTVSGSLFRSILKKINKDLKSEYSRIQLSFILFLTKNSDQSGIY